uniref:Bacteriophage protein n=1 Tax=Caenorhabditis tropicalis TaxID=1561998 RepID=A0A1I7TBR0_9PELO
MKAVQIRLDEALMNVVLIIALIWCIAKLYLQWYDQRYPRPQRRRRRLENGEEVEKYTFIMISLGQIR